MGSRSGSQCRKLADVSTSLCALCACGHLWCRLCGSLFHHLLESSVLGFPSLSPRDWDLLEFQAFIAMLIWMKRAPCVLGYLNTPSPVGIDSVCFVGAVSPVEVPHWGRLWGDIVLPYFPLCFALVVGMWSLCFLLQPWYLPCCRASPTTRGSSLFGTISPSKRFLPRVTFDHGIYHSNRRVANTIAICFSSFSLLSNICNCRLCMWLR